MQTKILQSNKIVLVISFIALTTIFSCVEEYWPDINFDSDYLLFVDGKITNKPGPYQIKLTKSVAIKENTTVENNAIVRATVIISDDLGNSETLSETSHGVYETSVTGIQGIIGRKYKLTITTEEGKHYESDFEELLDPISMISLGFKRESKYSHDNKLEEGFQFYVSTEPFESNTNYFYWELKETYKYEVPYSIHLIYYGFIDRVHVYKSPSNPDMLKFCYKTNQIEGFTFSTQRISSQQVTNIPISFLPFIDERAKLRYSLLAKQYTISENAQIYLDGFLGQGSGQEGLYLSQPYQIKGNLHNTSDPEEVVLGYFLVASTSQSKRIFVEPPEGVELYTPPYCSFKGTPECGEDTHTYNLSDFEDNYGTSPGLLPRYIAREKIYDCRTNGYELLLIFPKEKCIDCQVKGGVLNKPGFWQD